MPRRAQGMWKSNGSCECQTVETIIEVGLRMEYWDGLLNLILAFRFAFMEEQKY